MRQSSVHGLRVAALDHNVGWLVLSFAVSPGTWPGGAWVPGGPRPGFSLLPVFYDPSIAFLTLHLGLLAASSTRPVTKQVHMKNVPARN